MNTVNLFFKYINLELFEGLVEGTKPTRHNGGFRLTVIYFFFYNLERLLYKIKIYIGISWIKIP